MASTRKTVAAPAPRKTTLLIATRKGLWTLAADAARRAWKLTGPHFLGHIVHHAIADPRDARTILAAARTGHLGPTIFRSTDRGRTWKEAGATSRVQARQRPHRRSFVLADTGPPDGARRLVRGHLAAGTVPFRRRRCDLGRRRRVQRSSGAQGVVRRRSGRHARRPEAPFRAHRSARSASSLYRHVERRGVRVDRWWRRLAPAQQRGESVVPARARPAVRPRPALRAPPSPRARPALPAEPLRHLSAGPAGGALDGYRRGDAEVRGADRFPDGPAPARPRYAVGVPHGRVRRLAANFSGRQAGGVPIGQRRQDLAAPGDRPAEGAGVVDGQATGNDGGPMRRQWAFTSARRAARSGAAATRAAAGNAWRGTCRMSTAVECA